MRSPFTRRLALPALAAGALALAGCGSSSSSSSSSAASSAPAATATSSAPAAATGSGSAHQTLPLAANAEGQLRFDSTMLSAKAGSVTIAFTNMSPLSHNVTVASPSGTVVGATPTFQGASKTLTLSLKPGIYTFYCSVPGHRAAGMEGKLVVQ